MAQIVEMRRFGQFESFDEQPIPDLNSEALDFRAASELWLRALHGRVGSLWSEGISEFKNFGSYWSNVEQREKQARLLNY
jgi:hypothetical protein